MQNIWNHRGLAVLCCLLLSLAAFGQSDRGTITGTVIDPAGALVPNARVIAKNIETGSSAESMTTETGNYTMASLPSGTYEVTVEAAGFKRALQQRVDVRVAQTIRVDVTLQVGATTESVVVTAEAPMLRTENAEQSMNVSGARINALPMNFGGGNAGPAGSIRNWLSFVVLAPGVGGSGDYNQSINGAPGGAFKIYLEGQDVTSSNDTTWTSIVSAASVESIGDFSVQTSNFSAEFGQVLGGVFNFTTKSGTNQFHGTGFEYFTNEALDAARPFTHALALDRKHDFGGSIGGPVLIPKIYNGRNKTFFHFTWEAYRFKARSSDSFLTVPTDAYRTGNFSAALTGRQLGTDPAGRPIMENQIYDPRSDRTVNGQLIRDPFPNNIIPSGLLDPVAVKIQALIPKANLPDLIRNYQTSIANHKNQDIPSVKIDHSFNDTTKLSGYWSVQNTDQLTGPDGLPFPLSAVRVQSIYGHNTRLNLDKTVTPRLLLHLGAGYMRFHNPDSSPADVLQYDALGQLGLKGGATNPTGFPYISAMNTNAGGLGNQLGPNTAGLYYNDKITGVASASYVRNNHTYKLGGEFKQEVWTDNNYYQSQGFYNFNAAQTGLPYLQSTTVGGGSIGFPYASFLLGQVQNASVAAPRTLQWRKKAWALYIQDTWKVTRKLTLDIGLRWDLQGQGHELHYRTSQIGVNTPNPSAGNLPGGWVYEGYGQGRCNCDFVKTYPYAIGPRLGLAYQINDKTVFRAGWGISYSGGPNWWYVTGGSSSVGVGFNALSFSNPVFGLKSSQFAEGLTYNPGSLYAASLDPGIFPSVGNTNVPGAWGGQINDPNGGRPARVNQWNIALQRQFTRSLSVDLAYVGNRGVWLEANSLISMNAIHPSTFSKYSIDLRNAADRTLLTSRIDSTAAANRGIFKPYATFPNSATVAQALRPFPMYNDGLLVRWAPLGNSWYDSLQAMVTQRYSHGLDFTASFTWQKELALGTGGNPGAGGGGINDVFNRQNQKSLTAQSTPFVLAIGFNYTTPKFTTNRIVRQVVGDWTFGGVLRYASGALLAVPGSRNNLGTLTLQGGTRMNRVANQPLFLKDPNCGCIDPTKDLVLNPAAWADVGAGEWGVSSAFYNDYRWQRRVREDLSLGRKFRFKERMAFTVRMELFNAFNRLQYGTGQLSSGNPTQTATTNASGILTGGYGFLNFSGVGGQRNGQLVGRFEF